MTIFLFAYQKEPRSTELWAWWKALEENSGDRSALRKSRGLVDSMMVSSFHKLRILSQMTAPDKLTALSNVAITLANLRTPVMAGKRGLGGQFHGPDKDPILSELRFKGLLTADEPEDVLRRTLRALAMIDHIADLQELANFVYWSSLEEGRDKARIRLAQQYYNAMSLI